MMASETIENGTVKTQYNYSPFGDAEAIGEASDNPFQYTGRENDEGTGLYYYRARYYSPEMGRFISEDPIGLMGGINYFAYVGNSPCNFRDPLGLYDMPGGEPDSGPGSIGYPYAFNQYPPDLYDREPLSRRTKCLIALRGAFAIPCGAGGYGIGVVATPAAGWKAFSICNWYFTLLSYQICPEAEPEAEPEDTSCSAK